MDDWIFKAKFKVICTECAHDEFIQIGDNIKCVFCETEYKQPEDPDGYHLEPFDINIEEKKEH